MPVCQKTFFVKPVTTPNETSHPVYPQPPLPRGLTQALVTIAENSTSLDLNTYNGENSHGNHTGSKSSDVTGSTVNMTIIKAVVFIVVMVLVLLSSGKILISVFSRMNNAVGRREEEHDIIEL